MTRPRSVAPVTLALFVGLAACSSPTAVEEEGVTVTARAAEIEIRNARSDSIFVRLVEREAAQRLNLLPCPRAGTCPVVRPGGRHLADRAGVVGAGPGSEEAILHWWPAMPDGEGGFEATDVHAIVFPLR